MSNYKTQRSILVRRYEQNIIYKDIGNEKKIVILPQSGYSMIHAHASDCLNSTSIPLSPESLP